jgi:hypothetical protein
MPVIDFTENSLARAMLYAVETGAADQLGMMIARGFREELGRPDDTSNAELLARLEDRERELAKGQERIKQLEELVISADDIAIKRGDLDVEAAEIERLRAALKDVADGNDIAAERGESIANWPGSQFRARALAALAALDAARPQGDKTKAEELVSNACGEPMRAVARPESKTKEKIMELHDQTMSALKEFAATPLLRLQHSQDGWWLHVSAPGSSAIIHLEDPHGSIATKTLEAALELQERPANESRPEPKEAPHAPAGESPAVVSGSEPRGDTRPKTCGTCRHGIEGPCATCDGSYSNFVPRDSGRPSTRAAGGDCDAEANLRTVAAKAPGGTVAWAVSEIDHLRQQLEAAELHVKIVDEARDQLKAHLDAANREISARKGDPVTRLHNLCRGLGEPLDCGHDLSNWCDHCETCGACRDEGGKDFCPKCKPRRKPRRRSRTTVVPVNSERKTERG